MSNIMTIYRALCINTNKCYIGFTSSWPNRIENHRIGFETNQMTNRKFYNAIQKYGWQSFVWEAIYQAKEETDPNKSHTLNVMEDYFITEYNSIDNGYNLNRGGKGSFHHINSSRKKDFDSGKISWNSKGLLYFNDGVRTYRLKPLDPRCENLNPGRLLSDSSTQRTLKWYNDGKINYWLPKEDARVPTLYLGRIMDKAIQRYLDNPKICICCGAHIPYERRRQKICSAECNTIQRKNIAKKPRKSKRQRMLEQTDQRHTHNRCNHVGCTEL